MNPKQTWGAFGAPPPVVFCPSTLIFDTITVKFCKWGKKVRSVKKKSKALEKCM